MEKYKHLELTKEQIDKDLMFIASLMPRGYLKLIGSKINDKFGKAYISQFFTGKFAISQENECILDAALEILEEEKVRWEKIRSNVKKILK